MSEIKAAVKARLDVPGLVADLADKVIEKALDDFVSNTSNPYDDMLKAALWPTLEKALKEESQNVWDQW